MSPARKVAAKRAADRGGCTPISVKVAVLLPDDQHEINFGLTKGCNPDNSVFWIIDFVFKELKGGVMKTRIEVHVTVGQEQHPQAMKLAKTRKLSPESVDLLNGPVTDRARKLPAGIPVDKRLNGMLLSTL